MDSAAPCLCHSILLSLQPACTALSCTLCVACDHRAFTCAAPSSWDTAFPICQMARRWRPTPVLLPGKSHGWRSLVGCSPWGLKESDTTERIHFHFSLSCVGEGDGTPLQYPCLKNPRDRGAWRAAVYGVAQSRTRLKRLSNSSSNDVKSGNLTRW